MLRAKPKSFDSRAARSVFLAFLKLGLTSFGGPTAHIGYFRHEFVTRRQWLNDAQFAQLVALCQILPGPASSQVGFSIGLLRAGWLGGFMAWCGFTLPSVVAMVAVAIAAPFAFHNTLGDALVHGLKLAAVVIVTQALLDMARRLCPGVRHAAIALLAGACLFISPLAWSQWMVLLGGAFLGSLLLRPSIASETEAASIDSASIFCVPFSRVAAYACLSTFAVLLIVLPVVADVTRLQGIRLFDAFFRSGALVFGGGHVVLPLLKAATVDSGWIGTNLFLGGYAAAQALPGPLFTFATFLGWSIGVPQSWGGAAIATIAIFLPGLLLVAGALPFWQAASRHTAMRGPLAGINAAVVGLLAHALYDPLWTTTVRSLADVVFWAITLGITLKLRLPPLAVVLLSTGVGMCIALF
jgi:chromate transporter